MRPLHLNLLPHRRQHRCRRRWLLALQLGGVGLAASAVQLALWLDAVGQPQPWQSALQQSRRELAQARARNAELQQRWQQVQDWRRQRVLLPALLRQLRRGSAAELQFVAIAQQGDTLRLQAATQQPAAARQLLLRLRADSAWREVEWLGWSGDAQSQRFTLCLSPLPASQCAALDATP